MNSKQLESNLPELVLFCRALREEGLCATPAETIAAARTLDLIDLSDREEIFLSLRGILTSCVEEFERFEDLFERFWNRFDNAKPPQRDFGSENRSTSRRPPRSSQEQERKGLAFFLENWGASRTDANEINLPAAGNTAADNEKDFSLFSAEDLEEIGRLARRIVRRLYSRPSRRWKLSPRGSRVNPRASIRAAMKTGGELIELSFRRRKNKKTRLVVLCDVSGSMDIYSRLLLQFVYAIQNSLARVETFVFSTSIERITGRLKNRTYELALESLRETRGWSGGTLIGPSISGFNSKWSRLVDRRTIVVILSDGWDTGEPEELAESLSGLKRRAGKLIWLNPLLANPEYQPLTRGMQAALPHIDMFAPLHNLQSLRALECHLVL
ncbi:MAG: VWA containing CoxE family protein [Blastocatellia bacterium AA13]|nr:MAG: VWA containing CoxE family protein [Blastocatellia bacterium AA13]